MGRKKKPNHLINIQTGEILNPKSSDKELSDGLKVVRMGIKDLQQKEKAFKDVLYKRVPGGVKTFCDYWNVTWNREFDQLKFLRRASKKTIAEYTKFKKELKDREKLLEAMKEDCKIIQDKLNAIESHYQKRGKIRSLNFPKYS